MLYMIVVIIIVIYILLILDVMKPKSYPPGPAWLPGIGCLLTWKESIKRLGYTHLVWTEMSTKYGELVGLRLGRDKIVIVSGKDAVHNVLSDTNFDGRPDGFFFRLRSFGQRFGLVFTDGAFFNEQKKFALKHLKEFGFGKNEMENRIMFEVSELITSLKNSSNKGLTIPGAIEGSLLNNLWSLVAGERFSLLDQRLWNLLDSIHTAFRLQDMTGGLVNQMPVLRFVPGLTTYKQLVQVLQSLLTFLKELVSEHQNTISSSYDKRDLIDAFLHEMKTRLNQNDSNYCEKQLIVLLLDLLLAGAETTSSTLGFALLYLVHYPHHQEAIQKEIDTVLHHSSHPSLAHRSEMKLSEAFLMEVQRISNVTPTTISHRAVRDTQIGKYIIPKDTIVIGNLYSLHMDKDHWGDPEVFRPDRFIDSSGNIIQDDWFLPFGTGKRRCMGQSLAKSSLFLYFTSILQHFTISLPTGDPLPSLLGLDGATVSPRSFKCVFTLRKL